MKNKLNIWIVILLMAISFGIGTLFGPGEVRSGTFTTCSGNAKWLIHKGGYYGVIADEGIKLRVEPGTSNNIVGINATTW